jgi:hypothetical protein
MVTKKKKRKWPLLLALFLASICLLWYFWPRVSGFLWPSQEKILEGERKQLEDILKRGK